MLMKPLPSSSINHRKGKCEFFPQVPADRWKIKGKCNTRKVLDHHELPEQLQCVLAEICSVELYWRDEHLSFLSWWRRSCLTPHQSVTSHSSSGGLKSGDCEGITFILVKAFLNPASPGARAESAWLETFHYRRKVVSQKDFVLTYRDSSLEPLPSACPKSHQGFL